MVPFPQAMPVQEPGRLDHRPLPYQPNAVATIDCAGSRVWINMTNSGTASVHFAIYANAHRTDGPWWYDVPGSASQMALFSVPTNSAGFYDLTCYGPGGFNRRFAGSIFTNCGDIEASADLDVEAGCVCITLRNSGPTGVTFAITNTHGGWRNDSVSAGSVVTQHFQVATNGGRYDMTATVNGDSAFLRRFSGRLELPPLVLSASVTNGMLRLRYPAWARDYALESVSSLDAAEWITLPATPIIEGSDAFVDRPMSFDSGFFRLRQ
jgi:phospholipase C